MTDRDTEIRYHEASKIDLKQSRDSILYRVLIALSDDVSHDICFAVREDIVFAMV